jgi:signal transduction histidine kinase
LTTGAFEGMSLVRGGLVNVAEDRRKIAESRSLVAALSELAATVQRRRTVDDVLETAGLGALALGMRFGAFQIRGDDLVLRFLATAPKRYAAIEGRIGRAIRGLSAPVGACELVRSVVTGRRILFRHDLDLFDTFLRVAAGYDPTALDREPDTAGITTGVLVPLFVRDAPWGLIAVYSNRLMRADADAVALFATHVGSALEVAESLEELARTQTELVERERLAALGELAAVVAHEVRNPLGVLFNTIGSLRGIVDAGAPADKLDDAKTFLAIAAEEASRLNDIVSDLLEFARPYHATLSRCSIEEIVREIGSRDPRIDVSIAPPLPLPLVEIDARHVRQALLNLVLNGLQALKGGGRVTISARVEERRQGVARVRVDVADTGAGIPSHVRSRIFEPFFTTKATGTGLGLAIVKRIVDAHRGELEVDSGPSGTTFTMSLPVGATGR